MKFIASESLRKAETRAIAKDNALATGMMERAGRGLARAIHEIAAQIGRPSVPVRLLAGPGNNGGDAFALARHLACAGASVRLVHTRALGEYKRESGYQVRLARRLALED